MATKAATKKAPPAKRPVGKTKAVTVAALKAVFGDEVQKYMDLVWYARSDPTDAKLAPNRAKIEKRYPKETGELRAADSAWAHGFNSGCLAMARLLNGSLYGEKQGKEARRDFPELDT